MVKKKHTPAEALLDAHVQFVIDELTSEVLEELIEQEVDAGLATAAKLTLNAVVTRDMIKATALTYAADLELGGGLPELVGEIARAIYEHPVHAQTRFGDLMSDKRFAEIVDQVLEAKSLREKLVHEAIANPLYTSFASDLLYHGIKGYLAQNAITRNVPGASSMMKLGKAMLNKSGLDDTIEDGLKGYIGRSVQATSRKSVDFLLHHADEDSLRDLALRLWARFKYAKVSILRDDISGLQMEEGFVTAYEYWRELRGTAYYRRLIEAGIDSFFDRYGDVSLKELLDDLGIGREVMVREAMRFGPHVLKVLKRKKLLEPIVRRLLGRFYHSGAVEKVLAASAD
jgi:hypothetical protein